MITGILEPDTGTIQVNGYDIVKDPIRAKRSFGFVPDDPNIFPRLKAIEYLRFIGEIYEVEPGVRRQRTSQLADRLRLVGSPGRPDPELFPWHAPEIDHHRCTPAPAGGLDPR